MGCSNGSLLEIHLSPLNLIESSVLDAS